MKPLRIRMTAFGPFAGTEEVDFSEYHGKLFLIFGQTGSGKTTIFDAMCYALYGTTSGDLRTGKQMCCNHPDASDVTEVVFDFEIGSACYRVTRRPEQTKSKADGDETVNVMHTASVYELSSADTGDADVTEGLIASRPTEVKEQIQKLLGIEAAQFRQVVLIPQGDFRQLLTAKSDEREKILKVLFKTDIYTKIQDALSDRVRELKRECDYGFQRRAQELESVSCENTEELEEQIHDSESAGKDLQKAAAKAKVHYQKRLDQYNKAERINDRFVELHTAVTEQRELASNKSENTRKEKELNLAKQAESLDDIWTSHEQKITDEEDDANSRGNAQDEFELATEEAKMAREKKSKSDKRKSELPKLASELNALAAMFPTVKKLDKDRNEITELKSQLDDLKADKEAAETLAEELLDAINADEQEQVTLKKLSSRVNELQMKLEKATETLEEREALDEIKQELTEKKRTFKSLAASVKGALQAHSDSLTDLRKTESDWECSRVHVIAKSLKDDTPCPVCGAIDHPAPAVPVDGAAIVGDRQLASARKEEQKANRLLKQYQKDMDASEGRIDVFETDIKRLSKKKTVINTAAGQLRKDVNTFDKELESAKSADSDIEGLERNITENTKKHDALVIEVKQYKSSIDKARLQFAKKTATLDAKLKDIPKELQNLAVLQVKQESVTNSHDELATLIEDNDEAASQAVKALAVSKQALDSATKAYKRTQKELSTSATKLRMRLQDAGFKSVEAMQNAERTKPEIASLEVEVEKYGDSVTANMDRLKRAKIATKDKKQTDIEKLSEGRDDAESEHDSVLREKEQNNAATKRLKGSRKRIDTLNRKSEKQEAKFAIFSKLENVARGTHSGTERLSLQRYVLASFLDDVTRGATHRLDRMSKGRYQLRRALDASNRRSTAGLDLEVFDDFTGESRSVNTLSGGEMFLASLSLALGLSDAVQRYSGGVHLDSIFIDEGFGNLDSSALDLAIETLMELNQEGRMVGVISHVTELKERIDQRIQVKRTSNGSRIAH